MYANIYHVQRGVIGISQTNMQEIYTIKVFALATVYFSNYWAAEILFPQHNVIPFLIYSKGTPQNCLKG